MTVAFMTLGCKVNQYETQAIAEQFTDGGFLEVDFKEDADVYIINTCTVTAESDRKSRQMIRRAINSRNSFVVAAGCFAEKINEFEGVDLIVPNKDKSKIYDMVCSELNIKNNGNGGGLRVRSFPKKTKAQIKIEDGCNNFCSYCIIPYVRGRVTSRPTPEITAEAKALISNGHSEIVLCGIHISSYDYYGMTLFDLLEKLDFIPVIHLGSIEPASLNSSTIGQMGRCKNLQPHFHISLQSGSAGVLKRMNRHYSPDGYKNAVKLLRERFDNPQITTDIICGFPGETEPEFRETLDFAAEIGFSHIHIFPFSRRRGTAAYDMPGQVPKDIINDRCRRLKELIN